MLWKIDFVAFLLFFLELTPFNAFSDASVKASHCLTSNQPEVSKIQVMIMPMRIQLLNSHFKCIPYLIWLCGAFYLVLKCILVVKCLITPCYKYQCMLPPLQHIVNHEDDIYSFLEDPSSLNLVSCSPIHLQVLLLRYCWTDNLETVWWIQTAFGTHWCHIEVSTQKSSWGLV